MRITRPRPGARVDLDGVDLADPTLFVTGDAHLVWQTLRAECPVFRNPGTPGFWAVTRHADVRRVLHDHDSFSSERGTAVDMVGVDDPAAGKMMHAADPPWHQRIREPLGRPLSPRAVPRQADRIRSLVREMLVQAMEVETWDAAVALTRLPITVMVMLMGLPRTDIDYLAGSVYASIAPLDSHYRIGSKQQTLNVAHAEMVDYFTGYVRTRRRSPSSDLISHIAGLEVGGRQLTEEEATVNCYSLLVGGVVTTGQVLSTMLMVLAEQGGGIGRWDRRTPISATVEEALRWASPTTHFMRSARRDVVLRGVRVRKGDAVTAWIGSANRDETVFDQPYTFDPTRSPNRHIAFGAGRHRCVGSHLARLVLRTAYEEFVAMVDSYELAAAPVHLYSNVIAGLVSLPIRVRGCPTH